ncbi:MAG: hypothetical protein WA197_09545 [Candidatus Acidiferrales bacterium]
MLRAGALLAAALLVAVPSFAQSNAPAGAAANSLNIPGTLGIVAKLQTDLDATKNKPGDPVEADTVRDVKQGHDMLLKKGSKLTGHIVQVETFTSGTPSMMVIAFDQVSPAGKPTASLVTLIAALAPAPTTQVDSLQDGRGMVATNINSAVAGQDRDLGNGGELMATSVGVHGIRGMSLASAVQSGKQYAVIRCASGDVKLKKGTQVVFKAAEQ